MSPNIHVGNSQNSGEPNTTADAIVNILKAAHDTRMEQATVVAALRAFTEVAEIKNVTITNSTFTNNHDRAPSEEETTAAIDLAKRYPNQPVDNQDDDDDESED